MEFLLINHPLDCPICDQAGECRLQEYSAEYGKGQSRFVDEKVHHDKRVPIGARIVFDGERCIKCTRCVRFCEEVTGTGELTLVDRGGHAIIDTFPGKPLDNAYSGNTVDICPVGALTWKPFRFQARVWFLKNVPSICTGCARGCNVDLATYDHKVHRVTPRLNHDVNGYWMCDFGRQTHLPAREGRRLERATTRGGTGEAGAGAPSAGTAAGDALDQAATLLRAAASRHGKGAVAAVVSARLSVEDLHAARTTLAAAGIERVVVPPHDEGADDALLIRRDRTPNARGVALVGFGAPAASTVAGLAGDIATGRVKALLVVGEDPAGDGWLPASALENLEALVVIDAFRTATAEAAQVALPATAYGESEGVFVNCAGRAQRTRAAVRPHAGADPVWAVLRELGRRFGAASSWTSAAQVFDEAARAYPAFAGMTHRALGEMGAPVRGE
jgi:NADH-quinone oxidoreductase subunit G